MQSLRQYRAYVGGEIYRKHLKLTAPLVVLNVCSDTRRVERMLELLKQEQPGGNSYMLFQDWKDFEAAFAPPKPKLEHLE